MKTDTEKLEAITEAVTKALLANAFEDISKYVELAHRISVLVDSEIKHNLLHHKIQEEMLRFWPKEVMQ